MTHTLASQELNRARDIFLEPCSDWAYQAATKSCGEGLILESYTDGEVDGESVVTSIYRWDLESHGLSIYYTWNQEEGIIDAFATKLKAAVLA